MFVCACHDAADVSERFVATRRAALRLLTITSKFMAPNEGREAENRRTESNGPGTLPDVLVRAREQRRGAQNTRRKRAKNNNKKQFFCRVFVERRSWARQRRKVFFFFLKCNDEKSQPIQRDYAPVGVAASLRGRHGTLRRLWIRRLEGETAHVYSVADSAVGGTPRPDQATASLSSADPAWSNVERQTREWSGKRVALTSLSAEG